MIVATKGVIRVFQRWQQLVRSQRSRWVNHKCKALHTMCSCSLWVSHLTILAEHCSRKAENRVCLKRSLKKWIQYRTILGCAMFVDILQPHSFLRLSLQESEVDMVLRHQKKLITGMKNQWPTVKLRLGRIKDK